MDFGKKIETDARRLVAGVKVLLEWGERQEAYPLVRDSGDKLLLPRIMIVYK